MAHFIRLRVKLVDELGIFDEGRARKIIYGLNPIKNKLIRDARLDLAAKVGIDSTQHDLEIWVDDYIVPGYTSSTLLKEDEEILVKIVPKGLNEQTEPEESFLEADAELVINGVVAEEAANPVVKAEPQQAAAVQASPQQQRRTLLVATTTPRPRAAATAYPASWPRQNAAAGAQVAQMQFRAPGVGGARGVPVTTTGNFLKPSMQCFHWDSPTHIKTSCRFWHPRELCKNFPMCTHGAMACGFAHPFCSESGEFCACPPHARDPQKNHRRKMAPPGAAAAQAAAMDGQQQLVGEDYTFD